MTCSRRVKNDVTQNSMAAPQTRKVTMSIPVMPCVMASLPRGAISPQKAHARKMLRCAMSGRVFLLSIKQKNVCLYKSGAKLQKIRIRHGGLSNKMVIFADRKLKYRYYEICRIHRGD